MVHLAIQGSQILNKGCFVLFSVSPDFHFLNSTSKQVLTPVAFNRNEEWGNDVFSELTALIYPCGKFVFAVLKNEAKCTGFMQVELFVVPPVVFHGGVVTVFLHHNLLEHFTAPLSYMKL